MTDCDRPPDGELTPRQHDIIRTVGEQGYATLESLAQRFGVSIQSVRRDIIHLDRLHLIQRFHGGAGPSQSTIRLGYREKGARAAQAKMRIGRAAAALVPDGAVLFLDVGTTVEAVARHLPDRTGRLTVFTPSLASGMILAGAADIELHVLGGSCRGADGSLAGAATLAAIAPLRFDIAILGYSGFDDNGTVMDYDLEKIAVKQAALERAASAMIVGDGSKFARRALAAVTSPDRLARLVTDAEPPQGLRSAFAAAGLDVVLAGRD